MDRKTKIIISVVIVLLVILAILLFWFRFRGSEPETVIVVTEPIEEVQVVEDTGPIEMLPVTEPDRDAGEVSVGTVAKTFAERYASYSNESDFANLRDLYPLMTDSFQAETERMIATTEVEDIYRGVTSQAISTQVTLNEEETTAEVTVSLQRETALGTPQNTEVTYETLVLDMVKESGSWKINSVAWE